MDSPISSDPLDEIIELDFSKYWKACANKSMHISTIIWAQRWGARIDRLPKDVQQKVREAQYAHAKMKVGDEEHRNNCFICIITPFSSI